MCGACGGGGPDWSLPYVSGPRRRSEIASFATATCRGIAVGTMPQGWTVRTPTGGWSVARTLTELVEAIAPRLAYTSWPQLQAAIVQRSRGSASAGVEVGHRSLGSVATSDGARLAALAASAPAVLPAGDGHLRLVGFLVGVRRFERGAVALRVGGTEDGTGTDFHLIGFGGELVGAVGADDSDPHTGLSQLTG